MINDQIIISDNLGNKFYEIHKNGKTVFDYTTNEVLKTNSYEDTTSIYLSFIPSLLLAIITARHK